MTHITCPACTLRWIGTTATGCTTCGGEARITIPRTAAHWAGKEAWEDRERVERCTVSEGDLVEAGAKVIGAALWLGMGRAAGDGVEAVEAVVGRFRSAGLIGGGRLDEVGAWEVLVAGAGEMEGQLSILDALSAPHVPPSGERPRLGVPAVVSEHGHPSLLARVVDPYDWDTTVGKRFARHRRVWHYADVVAQAVDDFARTSRNLVDPGFSLIGEVA